MAVILQNDILKRKILIVKQIKIIFQTRLNSSRLPGKALLDVLGYPAIILAVKRAGICGRKVVVATSTDPTDDILCDVLARYDIEFIRGPLDDVMQRYVLAAEGMADEDVIVRMTGDNLLTDGVFIEKYLQQFLKSGAEYMGSSGTDIDLPYGISAEVFYVGGLRKIASVDFSAYSREHVTPPFFQNKVRIVPERSAITTLKTGLKELRCTMDSFEDYIRVCRIFKGEKDLVHASWEDLCIKLERLK